MEMAKELAIMDSIYFTDAQNFFLLAHHDYFAILAGQQHIIEEILQDSIDKSNERFRQSTNDNANWLANSYLGAC